MQDVILIKFATTSTLTVASLLSISGIALSTAVFWIKTHANSALSVANTVAACSIASLSLALAVCEI